jgi:hypothetical protein
MIDPLPIETAPKDGTRILLWGGAALDAEFPDGYEPGWHIGSWEASSGPMIRAEGGSSRQPTGCRCQLRPRQRR